MIPSHHSSLLHIFGHSAVRCDYDLMTINIAREITAGCRNQNRNFNHDKQKKLTHLSVTNTSTIRHFIVIHCFAQNLQLYPPPQSVVPPHRVLEFSRNFSDKSLISLIRFDNGTTHTPTPWLPAGWGRLVVYTVVDRAGRDRR